MKLTTEEKAARKEARKQSRIQARETARIEEEKSQPEIEDMTITIEWKRSRTWGSNPHASVSGAYKESQNGCRFFSSDGFKCSGCGYDKESTVIAEVFNKYLKYKLWTLMENQKFDAQAKEKRPYGICISVANRAKEGVPAHNVPNVYYSGGIGTSCYYKIAEYIGGKLEHVASGKTFDVYKYREV